MMYVYMVSCSGSGAERKLVGSGSSNRWDRLVERRQRKKLEDADKEDSSDDALEELTSSNFEPTLPADEGVTEEFELSAEKKQKLRALAKRLSAKISAENGAAGCSKIDEDLSSTAPKKEEVTDKDRKRKLKRRKKLAKDVKVDGVRITNVCKRAEFDPGHGDTKCAVDLNQDAYVLSSLLSKHAGKVSDSGVCPQAEQVAATAAAELLRVSKKASRSAAQCEFYSLTFSRHWCGQVIFQLIFLTPVFFFAILLFLFLFFVD